MVKQTPQTESRKQKQVNTSSPLLESKGKTISTQALTLHCRRRQTTQQRGVGEALQFSQGGLSQSMSGPSQGKQWQASILLLVCQSWELRQADGGKHRHGQEAALVQAYRVACHMSDAKAQEQESIQIQNSHVFNRLIFFMLNEVRPPHVPWRHVQAASRGQLN